MKPLVERKTMVEKDHCQLSLVQQCKPFSIHRSGLYYSPCLEGEENLVIMGWKTLFRGHNTSKANKQHKVYPYLLKVLTTSQPNQVWATDITYVPMRKGFMYLECHY